MTIGGQSGSGKSTILEQFKKDFIDLNDPDFEILSFEFEMLIEDQLSRYLASLGKYTIKDIYSATSPLDDAAFEEVQEALNKRRGVPVYYVDNPGTPYEIKETILEFIQNRKLLERNLGLVITIDHILLTKGRSGENEKEIIDTLMDVLNEIKKYCAHIGLRCLILGLSQLNRDIERMERVENPLYHFPNRNDMFAASSVYHTSDYVLISHRPATVNGMKRIINGVEKGYGPPRTEFPDGWPLVYPKDPTRDMVYWHLIKERFGKPGVIALAEDFKHYKLEEVTV